MTGPGRFRRRRPLANKVRLTPRFSCPWIARARHERDDQRRSGRAARGRAHDRAPDVLVTRWLALLAGEQPLYVDAVNESAHELSGTRYTFVAVTPSSICYLCAEHDDPSWSQDAMWRDTSAGHITPRAICAWKRPLGEVMEIGLGGDVWQWLPATDGSTTPMYSVHVGDATLEIPLPARHRRGDPPEPGAAITRIIEAWSGR